MKIGILTFQFAHNYGALLQAYALRTYLKSEGYDVSIINYIPQKLRNEYSMNPLMYSKKFKTCVSLLLRNIKRIRQYTMFTDFQTTDMDLSEKIYSEDDFARELHNYDAVVLGSDQIWNTDITGLIPNYYLSNISFNLQIITYAASFGKSVLNEYEIENLKSALERYSKVSVRETQGYELVKQHTGIHAEVVCDPVFLIDSNIWRMKSRMPSKLPKGKYIFYYSLRENAELRNACEEYAKKNNLAIYSVHPTCTKQKIAGVQLYNVGPFEFIWLIDHAEMIFSNSFHATAFSAILKKKLYYLSVKGLESRVETLVEQLRVEKKNCIYDFAEMIDNDFDTYAFSGKNFLETID